MTMNPADAYQRSIDQASRTLAASSADWQRVYDLMAAIPAMDRSSGGTREAEYADLSKQLDAAAKRFNQSEQDYQRAVELADRARIDTKDYPPAGEKRQRLDSVNNVLVAVNEIADGRGNWSNDPTAPPSKVQVAGMADPGQRVAASADEPFVVTLQRDGTLKKDANPNYAKPAPSAAPTAEYVYRDGKLEKNEAYRPPAAEINTTAEFINDPQHPGTLMKNQNYRPPSAVVNTTAEYIPDPNNPSALIKNKNYQPPGSQLTPGEKAVDTATAGTAAAAAAANLKKAQADADTAAINLANAQRQARQSPTDAQAQQAISQALQAAQLANDNLDQQIKQTANLNPLAVQQAQATLTRSKQLIDQAKLGDVYGVRDRIAEIRDLIASGEVDPREGDAMIAATKRGTTVYDALKQTQADRSTARGQDVTNKNALAGNFTSAFNSGLSTIADMNKYAAVGSTKGADAFVALLNMAQDRLKSYEMPAARETNYLGPVGGDTGVSSLVNQGQQQLAAAPPPAVNPAAGTGAQPITINIGSGAAANPQPPGVGFTPRPAETAQHSLDRNTASLIQTAASSTPATNGEVLQTMFPNMAQNFRNMGVL